MSDPRHQTVRVRRSPKVGVFLAIGAVAGALVALLFIGLSPADPEIPTPQALGFLILLLAPVGALVGGGVAVVIDAVGERRAREVLAERLGPEQDRDDPPQD